MDIPRTKAVYVAPHLAASIPAAEFLQAGKNPDQGNIPTSERLVYGILHKDTNAELNYCKRLMVTARLMGATSVGLEKTRNFTEAAFFGTLETFALELGMQVVYLMTDEVLEYTKRIMILEHLLKTHRDAPLNVPILESSCVELEKKPGEGNERFIWGLRWVCDLRRHHFRCLHGTAGIGFYGNFPWQRTGNTHGV